MKKLISLSVILALLLANFPSVSAGGGSDAQFIYDIAGSVVTLKNSQGRSLWYVHPHTRTRYQVGGSAPATKVIKEFGVYLKQADIEKIALGDLNQKPELKNPSEKNYANYSVHAGEILIEKEAPAKFWYVLPLDGKRYSLENPKGPSEVLKQLAVNVSAKDLKKIPKGNLATKKLKKFTSAKQFDRYIAGLKKKKQKAMEADLGGIGGGAEEGGGGIEESVAMEADESITNTQEIGVDEGGIVKAYKNFFVILRRGRLFSVKTTYAENAEVALGAGTTLTPVSQINAYPEGLTAANWYDELLISGNKIVVVGYSYIKKATEVGLFTIDDEGAIAHQSTYFLDSDDYYSSRNYASRLVGSTLIFYMPSYLLRYTYDYEEGGATKTTIETRLPKMRQWTSGDNTDEGKEMLSKINIYQPVQDTLDPTLHTVVRCDLAGEFTCGATSVLGPYSRNFYVSPDAVYLWVNEWNSYAYAYRMPLDEDGAAQTLRADGSPIDQFSFKEQDGFLNVLVRSEGLGEAMWQPETTTGKMALLRVPLSQFKSGANLISPDLYAPLPSPEGYGVQNRFVGQYLLYGSGGPWWSGGKHPAQETVYAKKFATPEPTQAIPVSHSIERLEVMGSGGIAIGSNGEDGLGFSSLSLGDAVAVSDTYLLPAASQGELRSHGYFFKSQSDGTGIVGLPVRHEGTAINSYLDDSAEVTFLRVDAAQKFSSLGSLASQATESREDGCKASCVDWYGNARPVFYMGRIFALLGYELVEGQLAGDAISEFQRLNFLK